MKQGDNNAMGQPDGHEPEKRYSIKEAIDILGMTDRSIYTARKEDGLLPYSQKGKKGKVSFVWADFETYWRNTRK